MSQISHYNMAWRPSVTLAAGTSPNIYFIDSAEAADNNHCTNYLIIQIKAIIIIIIIILCYHRSVYTAARLCNATFDEKSSQHIQSNIKFIINIH